MYIHIFLYVHIHMYLYTYLSAVPHSWVTAYVYKYICTYTHTYIYVYTYIHIYKHILYIHIHIFPAPMCSAHMSHACVCKYILIRTYTYIHIHTYMNSYIHVSSYDSYFIRQLPAPGAAHDLWSSRWEKKILKSQPPAPGADFLPHKEYAHSLYVVNLRISRLLSNFSSSNVLWGGLC